MGKCQQWISAWISMLLAILVLSVGGARDHASHTLAATAFYDLNRAESVNLQVKQDHLNDARQPGQYDLTRYSFYQKGSDAGDIRQENKMIIEQKQLIRTLDQQQKFALRYELASREVELAEFAQYEKLQMGKRVAYSAMNYIGKPYVWGGTTPNGFDCSGFTQYVLAAFGIKMPRNSFDQFTVGEAVDKDELQPGDLVFFSTYAPGPSHLGIYIGNGSFVHALNHSTGVITSKLDNDYYKEHFVGARRVL